MFSGGAARQGCRAGNVCRPSAIFVACAESAGRNALQGLTGGWDGLPALSRAPRPNCCCSRPRRLNEGRRLWQEYRGVKDSLGVFRRSNGASPSVLLFHAATVERMKGLFKEVDKPPDERPAREREALRLPLHHDIRPLHFLKQPGVRSPLPFRGGHAPRRETHGPPRGVSLLRGYWHQKHRCSR
jgi:hypothetical protein